MTFMGKREHQIVNQCTTQTITQAYYLLELKNNLLGIVKLVKCNHPVLFQYGEYKIYLHERVDFVSIEVKTSLHLILMSIATIMRIPR